MRPIPIAPLTARAELTRVGAKVRRLRATLAAADGTPLVQASAIALRTAPMLSESVGHGDLAPAPSEAAAPFEFVYFVDAIGYHTSVETRIARGRWGQGPVAAWMRSRVPLVAGETPSPLQRLLLVADSASGVAVVFDYARYTFVNADLTVALHRPPEGDWSCLDASTVAEAHGRGPHSCPPLGCAGGAGRVAPVLPAGAARRVIAASPQPASKSGRVRPAWQRAGCARDEREGRLRQDGLEAPGYRPPVLGERNVRHAGMLPAQTPRGLPVADDEDLLLVGGHFRSARGSRRPGVAPP